MIDKKDNQPQKSRTLKLFWCIGKRFFFFLHEDECVSSFLPYFFFLDGACIYSVDQCNWLQLGREGGRSLFMRSIWAKLIDAAFSFSMHLAMVDPLPLSIVHPTSYIIVEKQRKHSRTTVDRAHLPWAQFSRVQTGRNFGGKKANSGRYLVVDVL